MRQRHLLHVFSTFAIGGPQIRFSQLANHFGVRYRHTLVALDGDYTCGKRVDPSVMLEMLPLQFRRGRFVGDLLAFRHVIAKVQPDLLVTYNWGAIEWALANRLRPICRHIHFEDGFGADEAVRQLRRRVAFRRIALSGKSRVVVPSLTLRDIARRVWKLPDSRVIYIPNGINC